MGTIAFAVSSMAPSSAAASPAGSVAASPAGSPGLPIVAPDAFYVAGGPVAAGPTGAILASVELAAPPGARKWAVIYRSTGVAGMPVGVSGLDPCAGRAGHLSAPRPLRGPRHLRFGRRLCAVA